MGATIDGDARQYAAALGRRHFEGTVTLDCLLQHFGESNDPLIRALLLAAIHQPSRGFAGVSQKKWERSFWQPVSQVLDELEKGVDGRAPARRVYPPSGVGGIVGWSLFVLFAGASAAEHGIDLARLLAGSYPLPFWSTVGNSLGFVVTALATLGGIGATLDRIWLFRTRHAPYDDPEAEAK